MNNNYPEYSAGRLMTDKVPIAAIDDTIGDVEKYLLANVKKLESINYIYVLDKRGVLKGVISIKELFQQLKSRKVSEVMVTDLAKSHPYSDQEKVAQFALKHNIKSVPIVDTDNKFMGVVLSDDILDIVYQEVQEDIMRLAGVNHKGSVKIDDVMKLPLYASLKHRLPWLVLGLGGGILVAWVIGLFERTLAENIILAAFIPLVVYMASAVGTQVGFFIVRDLAINQKINFFTYSWRQFKIILFIGLIISFLSFFIVLISYNQLILASVIAIAIFLATLSSITTGLFIPYLASRLHFDPASVSGPIGSIVQDFMTVIIYLTIASLLI